MNWVWFPKWGFKCSEHTHSTRNIQKRKTKKKRLFYFLLHCFSVLLWHPTNRACHKREVSNVPVPKVIFAWCLDYSVASHSLYCQTWFPVYRDLAWQKYILRTAAAQKKRVSHISIIFLNQLQRKLSVVKLEESQFPSHPPTLIYGQA